MNRGNTTVVGTINVSQLISYTPHIDRDRLLINEQTHGRHGILE